MNFYTNWIFGGEKKTTHTKNKTPGVNLESSSWGSMIVSAPASTCWQTDYETSRDHWFKKLTFLGNFNVLCNYLA